MRKSNMEMEARLRAIDAGNDRLVRADDITSMLKWVSNALELNPDAGILTAAKSYCDMKKINPYWKNNNITTK
jgi:hypothetical protein